MKPKQKEERGVGPRGGGWGALWGLSPGAGLSEAPGEEARGLSRGSAWGRVSQKPQGGGWGRGSLGAQSRAGLSEASEKGAQPRAALSQALGLQ